MLDFAVPQFWVLVAVQMTTSILSYFPAARLADRTGCKPFVTAHSWPSRCFRSRSCCPTASGGSLSPSSWAACSGSSRPRFRSALRAGIGVIGTAASAITVDERHTA
jgi:hypothetical protein